MIPLDAGWDDIGSWEAMWNVSEKDADGNVMCGDVIGFDVKNSLILGHDRLVTAFGVEDLVVVETKDAVLVTSLSKSQGVKKIVDTLKASKRKETLTHKKQHQPWGSIEPVDCGNAFHVRRITVNPGVTFSISGHPYASLRWVHLDGSATLVMGEESRRFDANDSASIDPRSSVRLENKGHSPLIFLEVLSGVLKEKDHFTGA